MSIAQVWVMDQTYYYRLLRMVAITAIAACADDDGDGDGERRCVYEVEVKASHVTVAADVACRSVSFHEGIPSGGRYAISGTACGALCGDAEMNRCDLRSSSYIDEFAQLNGPPVRGVDLGNAKCPDTGAEQLALDCAQVENRGQNHPGCPVAGRRPTGLVYAERSSDDDVAAYLARSAHLEAASVLAFEALAVQLAEHRAPEQLVVDCRVAAREEVRHAVIMTELARMRGASPCEAKACRRSLPSLLELALENEVEGVVRESYGAVQALVGAQTAEAHDVRVAMEGIAVDEVSHAALSARIAAWLDTQLFVDERRQVALARRDAIRELRRSVDEQPASGLINELGVPSRAVSRRMLDALESTLWSAPTCSELQDLSIVVA